MSGSSTSPVASAGTAALTNAEIVDLRRFCGYPPFVRPGTSDALWDLLPLLTPDLVAYVRGCLADLRLLEADLPAMRAKLGIATAAVFERNPAEQRERNKLYLDQRRALCLALGISTGPFMNALVPAAFAV